MRSTIAGITQQEDINFLLTNRIPRRLATRFMGWFSRIENPLVRDLSISMWRLFADLDLRDAERQNFRSLHDCFIRRLKAGARPVDADPALLVSPCDAIIGASGVVEAGQVLQVKGFPYPLRDLLGDDGWAKAHENGRYVTLRLTSSMYHHFHAPHDGRVESVTYISGDTWNVNPIALKRVERLFCRNERAVIRTRLAQGGHAVTLVPVAAILVASIRLSFLDATLDLREAGPRTIPCDIPVSKGEEMGWFEHGSTIILFVPASFSPHEALREGETIRAGQPLFRLPG
ncbi:archaetidylserine decarboxylase [Pararoseomonas baculiformis]|uniref:archaetidylserine decarboxylase n=1 Tax=Pararoseomonas baculiformis TaxID=2820812 RepID=UPI001ADF6260|nr:archaetidylserine decarboxylase [Pararoseomonas baculiformis]